MNGGPNNGALVKELSACCNVAVGRAIRCLTLPLRPWASTQPFFSMMGDLPIRLFLTTPSGMLFRPTLLKSVLPPPDATGLTTVLRDGLKALRKASRERAISYQPVAFKAPLFHAKRNVACDANTHTVHAVNGPSKGPIDSCTRSRRSHDCGDCNGVIDDYELYVGA